MAGEELKADRGRPVAGHPSKHRLFEGERHPAASERNHRSRRAAAHQSAAHLCSRRLCYRQKPSDRRGHLVADGFLRQYGGQNTGTGAVRGRSLLSGCAGHRSGQAAAAECRTYRFERAGSPPGRIFDNFGHSGHRRQGTLLPGLEPVHHQVDCRPRQQKTAGRAGFGCRRSG